MQWHKAFRPLAALAPVLLSAMTAAPLFAQSVSGGDGIARGYSTFGTPGLIDMPQAYSFRDAELGFNASHFRNQSRVTLTFQASDRLSASFRYAILYDIRPQPGSAVADYRFDRSFSLHYRFMDEGVIRPAMAIGINDLVGTGIYGGEYVVATKSINPRLRASLGIGWGRLGSKGNFSNPLGVLSSRFKTRAGHRDSRGGSFEADTWFRGDAALFGGLEWQASDRLRLVLEYSSDNYEREDGAAFDYKSPLSIGIDWQYSDRTTLSAQYLYGSELGLQLTYVLNPKQSCHGSGRDNAPMPVLPRSSAAAASWGEVGQNAFAAALSRDLGRDGLMLEGYESRGSLLQVTIRNSRYGNDVQAVGRTARALTRHAPAEVERFEVILTGRGMAVTSVILNRSDLEELEFHPVAPDLLRATTVIRDARDTSPQLEGFYPLFNYGLEPYVKASVFDPDKPLRMDVGLALRGSYEPLPGLIFSGLIHSKIAGNMDKEAPPPVGQISPLPHVRSDAWLYAKGGDTTVPELTGAWYFRPGDNMFGRVTAGYLESMFGGVSAEILWKPQNSALAFGAELNYVRQRDFDQLFGFQDYSVTTGHISAYYDMSGGYLAQFDVGRYLAGDVGATLTLAREFDNGWKVGAFATLTDVSSEEFGEGSFDKGIMLTIPLDWVTGQPGQTKLHQVMRPVLRDGGARLDVPGRLYESVRGAQASELNASWGRFWK